MATRKKRRHPRARASGVRVLLPRAGGVTPCAVEDISLGGVFIRTTEQLLPGTELVVTLVRPGMTRGLKVQSTVANLRPAGLGRQAGIGLRFDVLTDESRSRLAAMLHELGVADPDAQEEDAAPGEPLVLSEPDGESPPPAPADSGVLSAGSAVLGRPFLPAQAGVEREPDHESEDDEPLSGEGSSYERHPAAPKVPPPMVSAPRAQARHDIAPGLMDRLQKQIRTLVLQLRQAEERVATKESEMAALRRRVAELEKALGRRDLEVAQLRAQVARGTKDGR